MLDQHESEVSPSSREESVTCVGCRAGIVDRWFYKTKEGSWHGACLRCSECQHHLEEKCFSKHGHLYCREDYYRIFGCGRCARCGLEIGPQELVMRARACVYHLNCFICAYCSIQLHTGDHFGMREGVVYCRPHYELILQSSDDLEGHPGIGHPLSLSPGIPFTPLSPAEPRLSFYNGVGAAQKGRPRKRKLPCEDLPPMSSLPPGMEMMAAATEMSLDGYRYDQHSHSNQSQNRTKRMRTSFKHHQLRTMKAYFALNQNPDAKDLKQLAQKTGLSKRVLQVWFQNARAKWRRNMLKQEHDRHVDKLKDQTAMMTAASVDALSSSGSITDLTSYSVSSSGDEGSQSLTFSDMCQ